MSHNRGYDNRGGRSDDARYNQRSGGSRQGGGCNNDDDKYSQRSGGSGGRSSGGSYQGGSGGYNQRGNNYGRNNYQGGRGDDLSHQMGRMNMGGGAGNMYNQHGNGPRGGRVTRDAAGLANPGDLAGGAQHPRHPVAKKDLEHNKQTFAEHPGMVQDKKIGKKISLLTNHAIVTLPTTTIQLHCYNIDIIQNKKPCTKREYAPIHFWTMVKKNRRDFPNPCDYIFNDVNMMWTAVKLPNAQGTVHNGARRPKDASLTYKYTGTIDLGTNVREDQDSQLLSTIVDAIATARVREAGDVQKYIVFKRCTFLVKSDPRQDDIGGAHLLLPFRWGIDARCGISIGIRMNLRAGITACYDVAHTMFSRPGYPLIRLLCELIENKEFNDSYFEETYDDLLRSAVLTSRNIDEMKKVMNKMNLRYAVDDAIKVDENGDVVKSSPRAAKDLGKEFKFYDILGPADKQTFVNENGQSMSIAQYYLKQYNIRLRYPNLPVIQKKPSSNGKIIAFPMEFVSYIVNPTRYTGFCTENMKLELVKYTAYTATQRRLLLQHIMSQKQIANCNPVVDNADMYMRKHKVEIGKEMLEVKATVLPPPIIEYGEGSTFHDEKHLGEWEALTNDPPRKVLEGSTLERTSNPEKRVKRLLGSIITVEGPNSNQDNMDYDPARYHSLMQALETCGQPVVWENEEYGQAAIQSTFKFHQNSHSPSAIHDFIVSLKSTIDEKYVREGEVIVPFVLIIFRMRCTMYHHAQWNDYNLFKFFGDNVVGVHTQGILLQNYDAIGYSPQTCKLTRLLVEKILGKIGTTHRKLQRETIHKPWTMFTDPKSPTLCLGIDVCHPSPKQIDEGGIGRCSVASVVGNIDFDCTEFRASSRIQQAGEERIVRFDAEIQSRIDEFCSNTGVTPDHIVVYRDGISEGDFQRILYEEKKVIENVCLALGKDYKPTITYIVVTKRHHTRFFLQNEADGYESQGFNIKPGTLVEDAVTTNKYYDFFLSTQVGQIGCARPTHYYVLYDTWAPLVSFWPCITHALTYNFCRTTTTVSLPAPVLYAHLAAKRAKETLDAVCTIELIKGNKPDIDNFEHISFMTKSINTTKDHDGMVFV